MATTLETISEALQQIDSKKSNLKKAFDDLQSHSSLLSSFILTWSDLDSHFTSLQNSLTEKFRVLQTLESQSSNRPRAEREPAAQEAAEPVADGGPKAVQPRPELVAFCEKMDGLGLRKYVIETSKERNAVRAELPSALRRAPDPAAMVLDAMEGFFAGKDGRKGNEDVQFSGLRRSCVVLLEQLMAVSPNMGHDVRERAKALAADWMWKGKQIRTEEEDQLSSLGFLHLVAAYGLVSEFDSDEILDNFVVIARHRQAFELCRKMVPNKLEDLIQKLISKGKKILALKFTFEFELTDKFPPVPILKDYVKESKKIANKVCKEGKNSLKSLNEATAKETSALKSVIKIIEERKLESEYPKEPLEKRIQELEKQKADRKRPTVAKSSQSQNQSAKQQQGKEKQKQQSGNKRPRADAHLVPTPFPKNFRGANTSVTTYQPSHFQSTGLLADGRAPYVSSSAAPYGTSGLVVSANPYAGSSANPYAGSSAGIYGLEGTQKSVPGNPTLAGSHLYTAEPFVHSAYHDRPTSYGGYCLGSDYHPAYYRQ